MNQILLRSFLTSGLKKPMRFLIVIALVLGSFTAATNALGPLRQWRVDVVNGLINGQQLVVHCQSMDHDLGVHDLSSGIDYNWSFKDNGLGTTLFWCYMRKPNNGSASFDVYWAENTNEHWLYKRCVFKNCIWTAKDDGIYLKNIPLNQDELIHHWD